jgi:GNAT superfamily N-acetyltransferase
MAAAWSHEHPEFEEFLKDAMGVGSAREDTVCFLAEAGGQPAAAAALCLHEGVALFAGATTVFEYRRRGLQGALLEARMRYAQAQGCDLAIIVSETGSASQRNAERHGFRIAYTRTKWRLKPG